MSGGYSARLLNLYPPPTTRMITRTGAVHETRNENIPVIQARVPLTALCGHSVQFTSWLTRDAVSVIMLMIQQKTPTAVNWLSVLNIQLPNVQIIATRNNPMRRP